MFAAPTASATLVPGKWTVTQAEAATRFLLAAGVVAIFLQACVLFALVLPSTVQKTKQMLEGKFAVSREYIGKVQ
eukprot:1008247-Amphidinium_carterae.1